MPSSPSRTPTEPSCGATTFRVADFDPDANVMTWTDSESGTSYKMMDRYVGAVSNQPGSDLSNGLFYQWGRKDPFGSSNYEGKLKAMYDMAGAEVTRTVEACAADGQHSQFDRRIR